MAGRTRVHRLMQLGAGIDAVCLDTLEAIFLPDDLSHRKQFLMIVGRCESVVYKIFTHGIAESCGAAKP